MRLYHLTHRVYSVLRSGLDPRYARGRTKAVWLYAGYQRAWAAAHVPRSHGLPRERFAELIVDVPRAWLARRRRGIYVCSRRICVARISHRAYESWQQHGRPGQ